MEDRHNLSEPRLRAVAAATAPSTSFISAINGNASTEEINLLEWEVDILRDCIVVDTIIINSSTLPPRRNKKNGKIVWCLPDTDTKLPSFGSEERRRIMEIFRDRRKLRKKSTRSSTTNANSTSATSTNDTQQLNTATEDKVSLEGDSSQLSPEMDVQNGGEPMPFPQDVASSPRAHVAVSTATHTCPPPPGFAAVDDSSTSPNVATSCGQPVEANPSHPPPPGFDCVQLPSHEMKKHCSPQQRPSFSTGLSPKYICYVPPSTVSSAAAPNISMALPKLLAKLFLELYYPVFTTATPAAVESSSSGEDGLHQQSLLIAALLPYYTADFQKSTSINGVHSVVSGDMLALVKQMTFVLGTIPGGLHIRSVVAQDLKDGGVLILIAGTAVTATNEAASEASSFFSHAITLMPMRGIPVLASAISTEEPTQVILGYQIHNDAFMLLS